MAKRSKSFRRYASGGNPRFSTLDAGLTAMRQQSDTQIRQLEKLSGQREKQDNIFVRALESKLAREAENRKEVYEIEEIAPRKMRADALETNNQRRQDRFQQTIKEQEDLASTWGELSPTIADATFKLASATQDYVNIQNATDDYKELVQSGYLNDLSKFHDIQVKEGNKIVSAHVDLINKKAAEYLKTGDPTVKKEHDVLLYKYKTRNPKLQDLKAADIEADIDGFVRDFISMMEDPNSENPVKVDHTNVAALLQFRGAEVCRQIGVNPKSKAGLRIMKAFRKKGLEYQEQYTLGYEYNRDSAVVNGQIDIIKDSHKNNDYESANNNWKIMSSTYSTLPVESRSGEWSAPINVNPKESFKDLAIELMYNPRYANNWTLFSEEVLGKNSANKYGYEIVNPDKKAKNPNHNRILGRHPNLENELLEEWARIHDSVKSAEQKSTEAKYAADAGPFIDDVKAGKFKGKDEEFWKAFDKHKNNPVVVATVGRSLAFSDTTINKGLLKNQLFKDLRAGNTSAIIDSWFTADEANQDITWAHDNLFELADALNVEVNKLDNEIIDEYTQPLLDSILKNNGLVGGTRPHFSSRGMEKEMASFLVNYYIKNRNQNETAKETWREANAELKAMLGIGEKSTGNVVGYGQFAHRPKGMTGDNRVVFLSKVGDVYNNTSSGEIEAMLDGDFTLPSDPGKSTQAKISYLLNAVAIEAQDDFTDEDLLEVFSSDGHTPNHPLLRQIFPHLKKLNITEYEFLNRVGILRSGKEGNELFCEMTGKDWCDNTNGTLHIKNPNDKLMQAAFTKYREQLGLEPWEAAMLGSSNLKVRDYIINKLDKGETDD